MNIGILGLGLIGGSFGRMLTHRTSHTVFGCDCNRQAQNKAALLHAFHDELSIDNADCLDMLVAALYPQSFVQAILPYLPRLKKGAIVMDFCGTKRGVVQAMHTFAQQYPDLVFVGGHPMAGREFSGIEHSQIGLFDRASMILVPVQADVYQLDAIKHFFLDVGFGQVVFSTAENHDNMIAYTSQLCHVVSNAYIKNKEAAAHTGYSAGSYRDLTRVARLNPAMWTQLMMDNRDKLSDQLRELITNLDAYLQALETQDKAKLEALLAEGNARKLQIDCNATKKTD